ncbi:hypothetical protein PCANC_19355 [Puccinia coronata f. sp. avenae]|uniref:Uncharacterized protein n=1 Tax=Puccinia coronata f. sp. avenae TaxID=200324 RepID=A0A2N5SDK7_9BASI|nr:hypothetical protein PCANC_19355 [Puccinia coronata f. sp. avenae]
MYWENEEATRCRSTPRVGCSSGAGGERASLSGSGGTSPTGATCKGCLPGRQRTGHSSRIKHRRQLQKSHQHSPGFFASSDLLPATLHRNELND